MASSCPIELKRTLCAIQSQISYISYTRSVVLMELFNEYGLFSTPMGIPQAFVDEGVSWSWPRKSVYLYIDDDGSIMTTRIVVNLDSSAVKVDEEEVPFDRDIQDVSVSIVERIMRLLELPLN